MAHKLPKSILTPSQYDALKIFSERYDFTRVTESIRAIERGNMSPTPNSITLSSVTHRTKSRRKKLHTKQELIQSPGSMASGLSPLQQIRHFSSPVVCPSTASSRGTRSPVPSPPRGTRLLFEHENIEQIDGKGQEGSGESCGMVSDLESGQKSHSSSSMYEGGSPVQALENTTPPCTPLKNGLVDNAELCGGVSESEGELSSGEVEWDWGWSTLKKSSPHQSGRASAGDKGVSPISNHVGGSESIVETPRERSCGTDTKKRGGTGRKEKRECSGEPPRAAGRKAPQTKKPVKKKEKPLLVGNAFKKQRDSLVCSLLREYNACVFDGALPEQLPVVWNPRLRSTAGLTYSKRKRVLSHSRAPAAPPSRSQSGIGGGRRSSVSGKLWSARWSSAPGSDADEEGGGGVSPFPCGVEVDGDGSDSRPPPPWVEGSGQWQRVARVELSTKVVDTELKLQQTLLHELCHAAAWLLDATCQPPHGPRFWYWARRASTALPHLPAVTTCHSYDIHFKFRYDCVGQSGAANDSGLMGGGCGASIGRHSRSIDVTRKVCGRCGGSLVERGPLVRGADGCTTPATKRRQPTQFSLFVKERFAGVKASLPPGTPHKQVMGELSGAWHKEKESRAEASKENKENMVGRSGGTDSTNN